MAPALHEATMRPRPVFDALVAHPYIGSQWLSNVRLRNGLVVGYASHPIVWGGEGSYFEEVLEGWPLSCVRKWDRRDVGA